MKVQDYIDKKNKLEVDFGEIEIAEGLNVAKRVYMLESKDFDKIDLLLNKKYIITDTGSIAYVVDTKEAYICHNGKWYEL